ncbi:hypothetical protein PAXRUDRAFT_616898 [Paxillus rubicundulus Ve08.2h10]|uniref:Uncharacterized protein n=1 Tax=Paxillus rubicundulus Ve08.2h10 TaxID=930991 RepID=A0A0D0E3P6_9AGAM|nr:hypothetical protein PAXRUDRAFT_616898 [Paxillus rubicundulus Ve08.2h10]
MVSPLKTTPVLYSSTLHARSKDASPARRRFPSGNGTHPVCKSYHVLAYHNRSYGQVAVEVIQAPLKHQPLLSVVNQLCRGLSTSLTVWHCHATRRTR